MDTETKTEMTLKSQGAQLLRRGRNSCVFIIWPQLPDEMRTKVQGILDELSTIQVALEITEQRNCALRDELADTLTAIGVARGDTMDASEMGLRVKMVKQTRRRRDRSLLERLGVSAQVSRGATIQTKGNLHLRLERLA